MGDSPKRSRASRIESALALLSMLTIASGCAPKRPETEVATADDSGDVPMKEGDNHNPIDLEPTTEPLPYFVKDGKPFCFMGANNYYLMYKSEFAVTSVLDSAVAMNLGMLRMWAFIDRGSLDGSVPNIHDPGHQDGIYFQYWDEEAGRPAYNDGKNGLQKLDFVLSEARKRGLTLTLVLTNNWRDFGGMDQYLSWYGLSHHHEFYTDPQVKQAYKDWAYHLVSRVNSIDGVPYKEDPAIFAWELANEPRTINYENMDSTDGWSADSVTAWADEMSTYVKSLDPNHMVAVGDEGFLNEGRNDWTYSASFGIDSERLTLLPNVDYGTYHLYPDHWGKDHKKWGNDWIRDHIAVGRRVDKPMVLEEYGIQIRREREHDGKIVHGWDRRAEAYTNWNNLILSRGGQSSLFWILSGFEVPGKLYADYDHFTVYQDDVTWNLLKPYSDRMRTAAPACVLAQEVEHGPVSKFVATRPAPTTSDGSAKKPSELPETHPPEKPKPASTGGAAEIFLLPHAFSHRVPS